MEFEEVDVVDEGVCEPEESEEERGVRERSAIPLRRHATVSGKTVGLGGVVQVSTVRYSLLYKRRVREDFGGSR
ncbi:hypothetical protein HY625_02765 [Candidatus Uhrbacteria bacterium]|nr:hypothetical protein [Candidatus Uhrbacteria bacterium]